MRIILILSFMLMSLISWGQVSNTERISTLEKQVSSLQNETWQYKNDFMRQLNAIKKDNDSLRIANDSLKNEQKEDIKDFFEKQKLIKEKIFKAAFEAP